MLRNDTHSTHVHNMTLWNVIIYFAGSYSAIQRAETLPIHVNF